MPTGYLTTHVLDTAIGRPAAGMKVSLYRIDRGHWQHVITAVTNTDGRTDGPILPPDAILTGQYELLFYAGDYLHKFRPPADDGPRFLDQIPIRFGISDRNQHYHVPLLLTPFSYSTYRGS